MPRGGVIGPIGLAGEPGETGADGASGSNGVDGGIEPTQPLKFVKEFYRTPNTFLLIITTAELIAAGLLKSHFDLSPATPQSFKIRVWARIGTTTYWRDLDLNTIADIDLYSIYVDINGDIHITGTNTGFNSYYIRVVVIG